MSLNHICIIILFERVLQLQFKFFILMIAEKLSEFCFLMLEIYCWVLYIWFDNILKKNDTFIKNYG